jgi:hypothetical protein
LYAYVTCLYERISQEPSKSSDGVYRCSPCTVGYYKPNAGSESCTLCPTGTNCDNIGVVIPCIESGYWRAEPPSGFEADFNE